MTASRRQWYYDTADGHTFHTLQCTLACNKNQDKFSQSYITFKDMIAALSYKE